MLYNEKERRRQKLKEEGKLILSTNYIISLNRHVNPGNTFLILEMEKMKLRLSNLK